MSLIRFMPPRGTTAQHATYTGTLGELTVDTDLHQLRIHDGVKAGGWPQAHTPLNQLDDVVLTSISDKQYLRYNAASAKWVNVSIDFGDLTNVPSLVLQSRQVTSGSGLQGGGDLSADRTISIAAAGVVNSMLAQMPAKTLKGNNTTGTAGAGDLTAAQVKTLLAITTGDIAGLATSATTDTTNASNIIAGTLAASRLPAFAGGDVTAAAGSTALTLGNGVVTMAKMAALAANSFIGNIGTSAASPTAISPSQAKTMLSIQAADVGGLAPSATTDTTSAANITSGILAPARMGTGTPNASNVLHGDGSWGPAGNAIDTTSSYQWTGLNLWSGAQSIDTTKTGVTLGTGGGGTLPQMSMVVAGGGTDSKIWDNYADTSGNMQWRLVNDGRTAATPWMQVSRNGMAVTAVNLSAPTYINVNNGAYTATGNAALTINNGNSGGQSPIDFIINGSLAARVRADNVGNLNYVATGSGSHIFFSAGDFGVGAPHLQVKPSGELSMGSNVWHTSIADGKLRLLFNANSSTAFNSPANGYSWRGGDSSIVLATLDANGTFTAATDVYAGGGFRLSTDTSFYLYNTNGYNYGSWRIGGARNTYVGLMLDDAGGRHPTFMVNGSNVGVYNQGISRWSWYHDYSTFLFHTNDGIFVDSYNGCALAWGNGQTSGRVILQSGGSPTGGSDGDVFFIY